VNDNIIAFLYLVMALFYVAMGVSLLLDARRNHYAHRPLKPIAVWFGAICGVHAVFFVFLAASRLYRIAYGTTAPWMLSWFWPVLLALMTTTVVGFYATFRRVR